MRCRTGRSSSSCSTTATDRRRAAPLDEIYLGEANYALVTVPPFVWNGFKGIGEHRSIVANCASIPHDPGRDRQARPVLRPDPLRLVAEARMSERPFLVVGASGLVGGHLARVFAGSGPVVATAHDQRGEDLVPVRHARHRRGPRARRAGAAPGRALPRGDLQRGALRAGARRSARPERRRHAGARGGGARGGRDLRVLLVGVRVRRRRRSLRRSARRQPDQRVRAPEGRGRAGAAGADRRRLHRRAGVVRVRPRAAAQELRLPAVGRARRRAGSSARRATRSARRPPRRTPPRSSATWSRRASAASSTSRARSACCAPTSRAWPRRSWASTRA